MQQPGTQIAARPFGGQVPTFSYAADIDDMPERKDSRTTGTLDAKWLKQNF